MRVKPANLCLYGRTNRPTWQRVLVGGLRCLATGLRTLAFLPVWAWIGRTIQQGFLQLERWADRL